MQFHVTSKELVDLFNSSDKSPEALEKYGGVNSLALALNTDLKNGVRVDDIESRKAAFGPNVFPEPKITSFLSLLLEALKDEMLIILIIAAIVSLILGLAFPAENTWESRLEGSVEGAAILGAVALVSVVQAINNYVQEKQFQKLNKVKKDVQVKVIRDGISTQCSIYDLVVGDVVILATGNQIPADGFYISGYNCSCNQSDMTGENAPVKKSEERPQLISSTYVVTGDCTMLVVAVGFSSKWGKAQKDLEEASEGRQTPLQIKLGKLARYIGFIGLAVATLIFFVLCIYAIIEIASDWNGWEWDYLQLFLNAFIIAVTIVVVAVPEGLPLAVTMALAYSLMKMKDDMCLVRYLPACETMGGVTQICSDKTGTLTQNRMNVVQGVVAGQYFEQPVIQAHPDVLEALTVGISRNNLGYLEPPKNQGGFPIYVGQPTECALLYWLKKMNIDYAKIRSEGPEVVLRFAFSSARKRMSTMLPKDDGGFRLYTKGAAEIILARSIRMMEADGSIVSLDEDSPKRDEFNGYIQSMAEKGLRTFALAFRDFDNLGTLPNPHDYEEGVLENEMESKLTIIGIVGMEDPVRVEVPEAVRTCQRAGITVRMVTGDNIETARSIARQCNIWREGKLAIEGPQFEKLSDPELDKILPDLVILARCSPSDKIRLVRRLKANNELVAVTGDGTNDAPALRGAHIGLAMGSGTEIARDASDIIILDDNFRSIVNAVMWGRSVFDNIRKFLQFQLTVNVSAMVIAALSALVDLQPLTAVQLLWVNLIMDSFGALALATERPTPALLSRPPKNISHPNYSLLSPEMWKMIMGQALYQCIVLYVGLFTFPYILNLDKDQIPSILQYTMVFNSFICCQLFNLVACRKVNPKEYNIFEKFFSNWLFLLVLVLEVVTQFFLVGITFEPWNGETYTNDDPPERIIFRNNIIGEYIFETVPLNWWQWVICILIGFVGFIWGIILRFIPTPPEKVLKGQVGEIHGGEGYHLIESQIEEEEKPLAPAFTRRAPSSTTLRTLSNSSITRKSSTRSNSRLV